MTTFALVHGGNYTSAAWERLVPLLDGEVVLVELPGRGRRPAELANVTLADNVAAAVDDLEAADATNVVLVGHSVGGITVAHLLNAVPERIARVVLVSCTIPPHGSAVIDHIDHDVRESVMAGSGGGVFRLDEETVLDILCHDLDDEQTAFALDGMVDETTSILGGGHRPDRAAIGRAGDLRPPDGGPHPPTGAAGRGHRGDRLARGDGPRIGPHGDDRPPGGAGRHPQRGRGSPEVTPVRRCGGSGRPRRTAPG
jgi:pimeloyl-ACP methyl ester carboxylesterase